jgi:3D (Asp-Asp-Asp) domain-containing protein
MAHVISRSIGRKLMVTLVAIVGFVLTYEISMSDSRDEAPSGVVDPTLPAAGSRQLFTATAYCKGTTTASGVGVRTGIAASDPALLPVGSVVNITTAKTKYNGVYTIMDTGPKVQGRIVDVYMWSCHEALAFGRQQIELTVLRLGWNPNASTPSLVDRLFRRREAARNAPRVPPPPPQPPVEPAVLDDDEEEDTAIEPPPPVEPAAATPTTAVPSSAVPGSALP